MSTDHLPDSLNIFLEIPPSNVQDAKNVHKPENLLRFTPFFRFSWIFVLPNVSSTGHVFDTGYLLITMFVILNRQTRPYFSDQIPMANASGPL